MTEPGDAVLDPYMGVGTAVVAALMHDRKGYGCDVVSEYVEIAWDRVRALRSGTLRTRPMGKPVYDPGEAKRRALMRIAAQYSHLNGREFLLVHHEVLLQEIEEVIASVDAESCRTKMSREKTRTGRLLYSPVDMNRDMAAGFERRGWEQRRQEFWVTADEKVIRGIANLPADKQKEAIEAAGQTPIRSYNQTDFVKERVAVGGAVRQVCLRGP